MKQVVGLMAQYNQHANAALYKILAALPEQMLTKDAGSYFGSVLGLLNHILVSDLLWLNRYRASLVSTPTLETQELALEYTGRRQRLHEDLHSLWTHRQRVDRISVAWTSELSPDSLETVIEYTNSRGEERSAVVYRALLHLFNHATHHRGQVSQILDAAGVQHDFSGLMDMP